MMSDRSLVIMIGMLVAGYGASTYIMVLVFFFMASWLLSSLIGDLVNV